MKKLLILVFLLQSSASLGFYVTDGEILQTAQEKPLQYENPNSYYLGFEDGVEYIKSELSEECVQKLENAAE